MDREQQINERFEQFLASLPLRGDAGQGWPIDMYEKKQNGDYKIYPTHRYHVGVGNTARIQNTGNGTIVIAPFLLIDKPEVYYPPMGQQHSVLFDSNSVAARNMQQLDFGKTYYFYFFEDGTGQNPWKLIKQSYKNQWLIDSGYGGVAPTINNQFERPEDLQNSINPDVVNQLVNETLIEQGNKALTKIKLLRGMIAIAAAAAFSALLYFLFKPKQD